MIAQPHESARAQATGVRSHSFTHTRTQPWAHLGGPMGFAHTPTASRALMRTTVGCARVRRCRPSHKVLGRALLLPLLLLLLCTLLELVALGRRRRRGRRGGRFALEICQAVGRRAARRRYRRYRAIVDVRAALGANAAPEHGPERTENGSGGSGPSHHTHAPSTHPQEDFLCKHGLLILWVE